MDETTFRILDVLARNLGSDVSINELTRKIEKAYGTAYYKNIYDEVMALKEKGFLNLAEIGKSSIASLNFNNYLLTDLMAEMEMKRKKDFLGKKTELQMLFLEMETYFRQGFSLIESICLIKPERNAGLNRAEFLFLLRKPLQAMAGGNPEPEEGREMRAQNETMAIHSIMQALQGMRNLKLDYLILGEKEFIEQLTAKEKNPLNGMLADKIAFFGPQGFWMEIKTAMINGIQIKTRQEETAPSEISEKDLIYNLGRLGYKEIGSKMGEGEKICPETVVAALLAKGNARRLEAVPVLLAKNRMNYSLLIFLCRKYGTAGKLLGMLKALDGIKPDKEAKNAIAILELLKTKEEKADSRSIKQTMRLYNAY